MKEKTAEQSHTGLKDGPRLKKTQLTGNVPDVRVSPAPAQVR